MVKKSFAGISLVVLILFACAFVSRTFVNTVGAETPVGGIINSDMTWTKANSPYNLTGNVGISSGVTLTIEAGVAVGLGNYHIEVNGTLHAIGQKADPIQFSGGDSYISFTELSEDWNEQTGAGSVLENAKLNSVAIRIYACSPKISKDSFTLTGIYATESSSLIQNNTFTGDSGVAEFIALTNSNATISGNFILGSFNAVLLRGGDVNSAGDSSFPMVENNLIINSGNAIKFSSWWHDSPYSPIIRNNTIVGNSNGIAFELMGGITVLSSIICYNNIYDNLVNVHLATGLGGVTDNVNVTKNWWGTTDASAITQTMYDYNRDFNLGNVTFIPFLASYNPSAPTFTNASAGAGGSISPSGVTRLDYGDSKSFTTSATSGYHLTDIKINGVSIGAVTSFIVTNITKPTTVYALFAADLTPTPTAQPTSNPTSNPTATPTSTPSSTVPSSPTPTPTSSPTDDGTWFLSLSNSALLILAIVAVIVIIGVITLVVFIKLRK